jgi:1-aminocyclopropane-1-carboxylate deaminase
LRDYKKTDDMPDIKSGEYWLPEGGSTELALQGVAEIISEIELEFDIICVPCGTGTTFAGLIEQIPEHNVAYGFSALKGADFLTHDVNKLLKKDKQNRANWRVMQKYHFGGFAKSSSELVLFMDNFFSQHHVVLESVYTAKMFYGIFDLIQRGHFNPGQKIVAIHTGGLQGNR